jgi:hypothetical protein
MPPELTRERASRIARAVSDKADALLSDYDAAVLRLRLALGEARGQDSDTLLQLAILAFLAALQALTQDEAAALATVYGQQLAELNPVFALPPVIDAAEHRVIYSQAARIISERRERIAAQAQQTGLSVSHLAPDMLFPPSDANSVRKALDSANLRAAQAWGYIAGTGNGLRKLAVPTIDNRTTDLCRNRMAWQERAWEEYFVDPLTGAQWLYPPFVGGGLPPAESFHYCRTIAVPL